MIKENRALISGIIFCLAYIFIYQTYLILEAYNNEKKLTIKKVTNSGVIVNKGSYFIFGDLIKASLAIGIAQKLT